MEIPIILVLLLSSYYTAASHDGSYTIPVENYETELQDLGETVDIPETPVRVVKITKTVAVKVPVPYPVKVIEKVPYPVHINKPYPVPVPQIVKIPHASGHAHGNNEGLNEHHDQNGNSYQVQDTHSQDAPSHAESYGPEVQSYNGDNAGHQQTLGGYQDSPEGFYESSYGAPSHSYQGNFGGHDAESFESQNYDQAIKDYLHKHNLRGSNSKP